MSLDVYLREGKPEVVFWSNITHNLGKMASAAGIYDHLWRPEEIGITHAKQLIEPLRSGLTKMKADKDKFEDMNPENGWGSYAVFVPWIEEYLAACIAHPEALVEVGR